MQLSPLIEVLLEVENLVASSRMQIRRPIDADFVGDDFDCLGAKANARR